MYIYRSLHTYLFFLINICLRFLAVLDLCCCTWAFSSCGAWASQTVASLAVEHGLGCSVACITFQDQRYNLCSLHLQADS